MLCEWLGWGGGRAGEVGRSAGAPGPCPSPRASLLPPQYPYRTHEHLRINDIPSLFKWGRTKPIAKLQGDQLDSVDTILSLLAD
jgi:hypothetical protein